MADAITKVTPEMQAAWVSYEPPEIREPITFAHLNMQMRTAFFSGYIARQPQVPAEDVERVIAQIKDAERAMIEERKGQYGSAFKCEQQVAIEGMHRQQIVGARLMAAALTALQVTEGDKR